MLKSVSSSLWWRTQEFLAICGLPIPLLQPKHWYARKTILISAFFADS